jgi:DNA-binding response OmpR family regulator
VSLADDGITAYPWHKFQFDLVLLDVMLPGMNGIRCPRLRGPYKCPYFILRRAILSAELKGALEPTTATKPFPLPYCWRIRALGLAQPKRELKYPRVSDLVLIIARRRVLRGSRAKIHLPPRCLLEFLAPPRTCCYVPRSLGPCGGQ